MSGSAAAAAKARHAPPDTGEGGTETPQQTRSDQGRSDASRTRGTPQRGSTRGTPAPKRDAKTTTTTSMWPSGSDGGKAGGRSDPGGKGKMERSEETGASRWPSESTGGKATGKGQAGTPEWYPECNDNETKEEELASD